MRAVIERSSHDLEIGVLGPMFIRVEGVEVSVTAPKARAVLGLLAVRSGAVVTHEALRSALWGEEPPPSASKALQGYISTLRRVLPSGIIGTESDGYLASIPTNAVDAHHFEGLVAGARRLGGSDPARTAALLSEAISLWRGHALVDLTEHLEGRLEAERLEELRRLAEEDLYEAVLECGDHRRIVGELRAAASAEPYRERRWGQLMVALYRSGRPTEALRAYQELRILLRDELGIEPSPTLTAIEASILRNDPHLVWTPEDGPDGHRLNHAGPFGIAADEETILLPGRLLARPESGVIGRTVESDALIRAAARVAGGGGREVVLVSGPAGIGKTTLAADAARLFSDEGACVLFGYCEEDIAVPYQMFARALGHYIAHAGSGWLETHMVPHGSGLFPLDTTLSERIPGLPRSVAADPDAERYLLFAAVHDTIASISQDQPVVLILDDLQWADGESLHMLVHLVTSDVPMRLLIVAIHRDTGLTNSTALRETLGALHRHRGISRMRLSGFDEAQVVALMQAITGQHLGDDALDLARTVVQETDGNPFFVSELLRHLAETGAVYQDASGRWVVRGELSTLVLPDSVREVISGRVGRLGLKADLALSMAAVIGRDFDLDLLARTTLRSEDDLLEILFQAEAVDLVREPSSVPGQFSFAHALVQHTLYENLGPSRRARFHQIVAQALEGICLRDGSERAGELARHWLKTGRSTDRAAALSWLRQAADTALAALAPGAALQHYSDALSLFDLIEDIDPGVGLDLSIGLGTAQRQVGDPTFRTTLLYAAQHASDHGDTDRMVMALLANDRGFTTALGAVDDEKVGCLERAIDDIPVDHPARALLLANLCSELAYGSTIEQRSELADEALSIAESTGDDAMIVRVLNHIALPLCVPAQLDHCLARSADALARAHRIGDPSLIFWAATLRHLPVIRAGDIVELDRCLAISGELAVRLNQPNLLWWHQLALTTRALIAGDTAEAEERAFMGLEIGTECGQPDAELLYAPQYMEVSWQRGTMAALVPFIEQAIAERPGFPVFTAALAMAHSDGDELAEARRLLDHLIESQFRFPMDVTWLSAMTAFAEAAIEVREPIACQGLYDRLLPWADQLPYTGATTEGPVSHYLGGLATVMGDYDAANRHFVHAANFSSRIGAEFFAARTDLLWGRMLIERGAAQDFAQASDLIERSHRTASDRGYSTVERRAAYAMDVLDSIRVRT